MILGREAVEQRTDMPRGYRLVISRSDSFRLGVPDAEILAREFYPEFSLDDLINLPNFPST